MPNVISLLPAKIKQILSSVNHLEVFVIRSTKDNHRITREENTATAVSNYIASKIFKRIMQISHLCNAKQVLRVVCLQAPNSRFADVTLFFVYIRRVDFITSI